MKLLIVHLLETAALRSDGVAVHVRALTTGLERAGHEVVALARSAAFPPATPSRAFVCVKSPTPLVTASS